VLNKRGKLTQEFEEMLGVPCFLIVGPSEPEELELLYALAHV
jgi:hypothetical protein